MARTGTPWCRVCAGVLLANEAVGALESRCLAADWAHCACNQGAEAAGLCLALVDQRHGTDMPVSGLVITLDEDIGRQREVLAALASDGRLTVGVPCNYRLPLVVETPSPAESESLIEELLARRGITFVDVVCVDFSDEEG